jgi:hypothetical protein
VAQRAFTIRDGFQAQFKSSMDIENIDKAMDSSTIPLGPVLPPDRLDEMAPVAPTNQHFIQLPPPDEPPLSTISPQFEPPTNDKIETTSTDTDSGFKKLVSFWTPSPKTKITPPTPALDKSISLGFSPLKYNTTSDLALDIPIDTSVWDDSVLDTEFENESVWRNDKRRSSLFVDYEKRRESLGLKRESLGQYQGKSKRGLVREESRFNQCNYHNNSYKVKYEVDNRCLGNHQSHGFETIRHK